MLESNNFIRSGASWMWAFSVDIQSLFCYTSRHKVWEERRMRRLCTVDQTPIYSTEHTKAKRFRVNWPYIQWIRCNRFSKRTSYGDIAAISSVFKALDVLCWKGDYFCGLICNRLAYYHDRFSQCNDGVVENSRLVGI